MFVRTRDKEQPTMPPDNWIEHVTRASLILKPALGEYCARLYLQRQGRAAYLKTMTQHLNSTGKFRVEECQDEAELLSKVDTRRWLKLIQQQFNGILSGFVKGEKKRNDTLFFVKTLLDEFNGAAHQEAFTWERAYRVIDTAVILVALINQVDAEDELRTLRHELIAAHPAESGQVITPQTPIVYIGAPIIEPEGEVDGTEQHMPVSLTLHAVTAEGQHYSAIIDEQPFIVGRGRDAHLRINDPQVSRCHIQISFSERGQPLLTDPGSRNGTFMNGERLTTNTPVSWRIGQQVVVGNTLLVLKWTT